MDRLQLLWVDMAVLPPQTELPAAVTLRCRVSRANRAQAIDQQVARSRPDAVWFDFDYPDQGSLRLAAALKESHPSVPMVMLTVQHSEALAVWAFRSRFADYMAKPVAQAELERCLDRLEESSAEQRGQLRRRIASQPIPIPEDVPTPTAGAIALLPAVYYVEKNFHTKITSDDVARLCAMSPFRFGRAFKDAFGASFRDYVVRFRLQEASRLLQNPQASVTEVAYSVGFNDISYFSRMFKRHFGVAPSAVQEARATVLRGAERLLELPPLLLPHAPRLN